MTERGYDLLRVLDGVDPAAVDYKDWIAIGMALKAEGYSVDDWDRWSKRDAARYHARECARKWAGFTGSGVRGGSIVQIAKQYGWQPDDAGEMDWDSVISRDTGTGDYGKIIDTRWLESRDVPDPNSDWSPARQLTRYLELLFEASETVGYVTESWYNEEKRKYLPTKGVWDRTAGELIAELSRCGDDIGSVLGDYKSEAGAWIRFNPLDGAGCKNENVTEYRYALVESDKMPIEQQYAILHELELPVAVLIHSGGKSLHAIVHIDAADYGEYRKRVDYLYDVCQKNGLVIDSQNRNPSRLSRLPGAMRNGQAQYIVAEKMGKENYAAWRDWIEAANDELPDPESMASVWNDLPPLSPALIDGVLRQGHKMLLVGPSKAGKSFALIELCCAIAEGRRWLGWNCTEGRVMYVNLELDRASCLHRFRDVYDALGWSPEHLDRIDVWNLRGNAIPMDKLAPKLIRRAQKRNYIAVVIDPIYKVITGDENSADQMANFCNQFDKVCTELGCAVVYCHHHSKGSQGQKRSIDRASGSGVFARDPDAMLDMLELETTDAIRIQEENKAGIAVCKAWLNRACDAWEEEVSQDAMCSLPQIMAACERLLPPEQVDAMCAAITYEKQKRNRRTAWRISGTLREFESFPPRNVWFEYPVHKMDETGSLADIGEEGASGLRRAVRSGKQKAGDRSAKRRETLETAFSALSMNGDVKIKDLMEYTGLSKNTVRGYIDEHPGFERDGDGVKRIQI